MDGVILIEQDGRAPLTVVVESTLVIGRECDGLLVVDDRVSRRHVSIENDAGRLVVTDLDSSNGTFLDGERITSPVVLLPGSVLMLGSTRITLRDPSAPAAPTPNPESARRTVVGAGQPARPVRPLVTGGVATDQSDRRTSIENVARAVEAEAPRIDAVALGQDDTVTIMFSDIESSTEQALALGDVEWMDVLRVHNSIFERRVADAGGTIIKNQGDGYMVTFASARRAVLCCARVQRDLDSHSSANPDVAIRVRMGCHTGEAIHESGDLFGRHVIIAARIANLADGAQILVSSIVKEITAARGDLVYGEPTRVELKGVEGDHDVYELDWRSAPS